MVLIVSVLVSTDCGGAANDYTDDDSAVVTVDNVVFAKTLSDTSAIHTSGNNLTIGEVASFALTITLPEGTIPSLTVTDFIPDGMAYVANSFSIDDSNFGGFDVLMIPLLHLLPIPMGQTERIWSLHLVKSQPTATTGTDNNILVINFDAVR